jgi:hypothetical protein
VTAEGSIYRETLPHGTSHTIYRFLHDNDSFPLAVNRTNQDIVQLRREEEFASSHESISFGLMQCSKEQGAIIGAFGWTSTVRSSREDVNCFGSVESARVTSILKRCRQSGSGCCRGGFGPKALGNSSGSVPTLQHEGHAFEGRVSFCRQDMRRDLNCACRQSAYVFAPISLAS